MMEILGNYMLANFLETICWQILGNYMLANSGGYQQLLMGVIMAQCYDIILRFQGNDTWSSAEHPGSADLSRMKRSEAREVGRGMGMLNPRWCQSESAAGKRNRIKVNLKTLA